MTNFEKIISEITVQKFAELRIKRYHDYYFTDDGAYYFYSDALKAEIEWLKGEVDNNI